MPDLIKITGYKRCGARRGETGGGMHAYTAPWKGKVEKLEADIERNELSWVSFAMRIKDYASVDGERTIRSNISDRL